MTCSRRNTTPFLTLAPNKSICSAVVGQLAFTVAAEVTGGWVESRVATEVKGRWVGTRVTAAEVVDGWDEFKIASVLMKTKCFHLSGG